MICTTDTKVLFAFGAAVPVSEAESAVYADLISNAQASAVRSEQEGVR
jgi:hypothetical protein